MSRIKVLINKRTGEKLILDLDSPNVGILTSEEFEKSTLGKRRFRKDVYIDENIDSENDDYPSQEEIEREVEEALEEIEID